MKRRLSKESAIDLNRAGIVSLPGCLVSDVFLNQTLFYLGCSGCIANVQSKSLFEFGVHLEAS